MSVWWLLLDGALGTMAGCVAALAIAAVRFSARYSVTTWRTDEPKADFEPERERVKAGAP